MTTERLESDPARQATDTIRGYVYQFYQSVLAWITLDEDEILFLEGAEDFDIYHNQDVQTVQVKDTKKSGSFTLNHHEATKALNNFWQHKQSNPEYKINFRFLTTSPIGKERNAKFGQNTNGIDYWQMVKEGLADVGSLKDHLLTLKLSDPLISFLRESSEEDILEQLVKRIYWDTGQRPMDVLIHIINDKLVSYGIKLGISANDSLKARAPIFEKIASTISSLEDRVLLRSHFALVFEKATGSHQSFSITQALIALAGQSNSSVFESIRPILEGGCNRQKLVEKYSEILHKRKVLFLLGSTGTGKTTLASLLANIINKDWLSLNLRGLEPKEARNILAKASQNYASRSETPCLIIDDINFKQLSQFESQFLGLTYQVTTNNAYVIITSQSNPPQDIFSNLWINDGGLINAPYFDKNDIEELLRINHCPSTQLGQTLTKVIVHTTQGHPQLVHARIRFFEKQGWPTPDINTILAPPDIEKVKQDARNRLFNDLPTENSRTLAYRLSILTLGFPRRVAIELAEAPIPIDSPGEALEILIGPWVEEERKGYYRISPLIKNAASKIFSLDETKRLNETAALAYVKTPSISISEASTALMHAFVAMSEKALSLIVPNIIGTSFGNREAISRHLFWITSIATKPGSFIYKDNPILNSMMRHLQFVVAAYSSEKDTAADIATVWLGEIQSIEPESFRNRTYLLAYMEIFIAYEVPFDCGVLVGFFPKLMRIIKSSDKFKSLLEGFEKEGTFKTLYDHTDPIRIMFSFIIPRIRNKDDLKNVFEALEKLSAKDREYLLQDFNNSVDLSTQLINVGWIKEADKSNENIAAYIDLYSQIAKYAHSWRARNLFFAAVTVPSILYDENLSDYKKAIDVLNHATELVGEEHPIIANQHAKVLFNNKQYQEALDIWATLLPTHYKEMGESYLYSWRDAAIAASNLGLWPETANLFESGSSVTSDENEPYRIIKIGMLADSAFAEWKAGNTNDALKKLANVLTALETISKSDVWQAKALLALVGHAIGWLYANNVDDRANTLTEPFAGMISNPYPDKGLKEWKTKELKHLWLLLGFVETKLGLSLNIRSRAEKLNDGRLPTLLELSRRLEDFQRMFKTAQFVDLIHAYVELIEAMATSKQLRGKTNTEFGAEFTYEPIQEIAGDYWTVEANIISLFSIIITALTVITARGHNNAIPVEKWESDCLELGIKKDKLDRFFSILKQQSQDYDKNILHEATLKGLLDMYNNNCTPSRLFEAHFYLLNLLSQIEWKVLIDSDIANLISMGWSNVIENQRFHLTMPRLYEQDLKNAIKDRNLSGMPKAANILLIANGLVGSALAPGANAWLQSIIDSQPDSTIS